jgi:putative phosphoesterase
MKIAIMSDSHDNWLKLEEGIDVANTQQCTMLLFAGDLISPPGIAILEKFKGNINFVWGNNEGEKVGISRKMDSLPNITMCGDIFDEEIEGIKVFMNHYPKIVELAALTGKYDLCIHGHTHIYRHETFGNTLLINPGEIQGYKTGESSFVTFDTQTRELQKHIV